jgi:toxin ParE1/3/4
VKRTVVWSRAALDDLKAQIGFIARDNPAAARSIAARIRKTGEQLAEYATGHPGRVSGTYEKSVHGLPFILAYSVERGGPKDTMVILHVIHTSRNWPDEEWPG